MLVLVVVQVTLGAFVVLTGLQPIVNTAHVVNGALLLATSVVLTLRSHWHAADSDGWTAAHAGHALQRTRRSKRTHENRRGGASRRTGRGRRTTSRSPSRA